MYYPINVPGNFWTQLQDLGAVQTAHDGISFNAGIHTNAMPVEIHLTDNSPTLYVLGQVGTGKSSFLNFVLYQLMYKYTPWALSLVVLDTKQRRFSQMFANHGAPHIANLGYIDAVGADFCTRAMETVEQSRGPIMVVIDEVITMKGMPEFTQLMRLISGRPDTYAIIATQEVFFGELGVYPHQTLAFHMSPEESARALNCPAASWIPGQYGFGFYAKTPQTVTGVLIPYVPSYRFWDEMHLLEMKRSGVVSAAATTLLTNIDLKFRTGRVVDYIMYDTVTAPILLTKEQCRVCACNMGVSETKDSLLKRYRTNNLRPYLLTPSALKDAAGLIRKDTFPVGKDGIPVVFWTDNYSAVRSWVSTQEGIVPIIALRHKPTSSDNFSCVITPDGRVLQ